MEDTAPLAEAGSLADLAAPVPGSLAELNRVHAASLASARPKRATREYEGSPTTETSGNPYKGSVLGPKIIDDRGWRLYEPEFAPTRHMIMVHWSDDMIAISARRPDGQWFRARFLEDGTPTWEPTSRQLIGWCHLPRAL
jgi:hypothetical protein